MTYAHLRGLIHRDIKPENILLRRLGGDVVLADFGLVKMVGEDLHRSVTSGLGQESSAQSGRGAQASGPGGGGTPDYMSPEQFESGVVTVRSDMYQVGGTLSLPRVSVTLFSETPVTTKEKRRLENLLRSRLKDKAAMLEASRVMDALRRRFGRPSAGFDSLALLRHVRYAR